MQASEPPLPSENRPLPTLHASRLFINFQTYLSHEFCSKYLSSFHTLYDCELYSELAIIDASAIEAAELFQPVSFARLAEPLNFQV